MLLHNGCISKSASRLSGSSFLLSVNCDRFAGETKQSDLLSSDQSHLNVTFLGPDATAVTATLAANLAATG